MQNHGARIKVLLLEPDIWRRTGIRHFLETSGAEFDVLDDLDHGRILASRYAPEDLHPDIIMLARSLVAEFKVPVLSKIRSMFPAAPILVHGYDGSVRRVADYMAAGAGGYFTLSSDRDELLHALRHVARGRIWAPAESVSLVIERARSRDGARTSAPGACFIAPQEITILKLLKDGLSNKEIAASLGVAEVTIKAHLTKLYRRFGIRTRLQLLSYAMTNDLIAGEVHTTPFLAR